MTTLEADQDSSSLQEAKAPPARVSALIELAIIIAVFFAVREFARSYNLIGSGSMGILAAVLVGTLLMKRRGRTWHELGLRLPKSPLGWLASLALTALAMALVFLGIQTLVVPIISALIENPDFGGGRENFAFFFNKPLVFAAYMILVVWIGAALGEELFARGLLMNHIAEAMGFSKLGWIVALFGQAIFFGFARAYQGVAGMIITGSVGFFFGIVYLLGLRSLLPVIIAHGLVNTISLTQLYLSQSTG